MATRAASVTHASAVTSAFTPSRPAPLTGFVGRERELADIRQQLQGARLVTLTGGGGSGKTRLATEYVARFSADFADGVAWVDLATLASESLLGRHVSCELGLVEDFERSPTEVLIARLAPLTTLLVVDNCEHLVSAVADLLQTLLGHCPHLRVLATSREALGIGGETAWLVPPLSVPATDDATEPFEIGQYEAVQLFVARARAVRPTFELTQENARAVGHICRRLDGIPLALELAAARTHVLGAEQIAERLDDVFSVLTTNRRTALPRHRTLREAIDWSHALLDEAEQIVFRRLSVFMGGCTLEAAEAVCSGEGVAKESVLDLLSALVDKSLVLSDVGDREARFTLLEPVRQYAMGHLRWMAEVDQLRNRHAEYFLALAERAEPHMRGGARHTEWVMRLETEHANLRTALEWLGSCPGRLADQLRLDVALVWFHFAVGLFREPRARMMDALNRAEDVPPLLRGQALSAVGHQAIWLGDFGSVREPFVAAVEILRDCGDPASLSFALTGLGASAGLARDGVTANEFFDEAQAVLGGHEGATRDGFPTLLLYSVASYWRGVVAQVLGDAPAARAAYQVSVDAGRAFDHPTVAHPLGALGRLLAQTGDPDGAEAALAESMQIHLAHDDRWGLANVAEGGAHLAAARGEWARAARLLGASDRLRDAIGATLPPHDRPDRAALAETIVRNTSPAEFSVLVSAGRAIPTGELAREVLGADPLVEDAPPLRVGPAESAPPTEDAGVPPLPARAPATEQLRVLALGPLEITVEGQAVEGGAWGSAKPRELLLFLLSRPEGSTRDQVGAALWPDAGADRVANSFHVTLHRLRKALGHAEWIVGTGDRYRLSPEVACHFDVSAFEAAVPQALRELGTHPDAARRLQDALVTYRGPFLQDEVMSGWHLDIRDRLARLRVDGLLGLGSALMAERRYLEASDLYRRAIETDELHEGAYRHLMTCLAHLGDRAQSLRLFQRLTALLEQELEAEPEAATVALYERLKGSDAL